MLENINHPTLKQLKKIKSLSLFNNAELESFALLLEIHTAKQGETLINIGEPANYHLYILKGSATKQDSEEHRAYIKNEINDFYISQTQIQASLYTITAITDVQYITIYPDELNRFTHLLEPDSTGIDVDYLDQSDQANDLTFHIFQDIMADKIRVPAMPEIAIKIQRLFDNDNADVDSICALIQADASLSAKLLRIANSPVYSGYAAIDSINQAIVRMGMETLRNQVIIHAVSEMLSVTSSKMKIRMRKLWKESRRVAAFSRILSQKITGFNHEAAQMAGLLCNLGTLAIVQYIQDHHNLSYDEKSLDQTIINLRPQINSFLMHKWNLGDDIITVAEESHDWFRYNDNEADLCDVILIARYFSLLNENSVKKLPVLSRIPAYKKLKSQGFIMSDCISFVKESHAEVEQIENMLGSV